MIARWWWDKVCRWPLVASAPKIKIARFCQRQILGLHRYISYFSSSMKQKFHLPWKKRHPSSMKKCRLPWKNKKQTCWEFTKIWCQRQISVAQITLIVRWELSTSIFGRVMCVEGQTALVRPFKGEFDMLPKWPPIRAGPCGLIRATGEAIWGAYRIPP